MKRIIFTLFIALFATSLVFAGSAPTASDTKNATNKQDANQTSADKYAAGQKKGKKYRRGNKVNKADKSDATAATADQKGKDIKN